MKRFLPALASLCMLGACVSRQSPADLSMRPVGFDAMAGWDNEQGQALLPILRQNCRRLSALPPETILGGAPSLPAGRRVGDWASACAALNQATDGRNYIQTWFQPYSLDVPAFYTGYYEPQIEASLERGGPYQTPLYRRPADLVRVRETNGQMVTGHWLDGRFMPYHDRRAIDEGALAGRGLELAWAKDPVDVFFLQIQGSGRLILPDGRRLRVGYDGRNGLPYVPIGRVLVREGALAESNVNMDSIRAWLAAHPDKIKTTLEQNPNYVFFRTDTASTATEGPKGAFGVSLTAGRSVAVDRAIIPFAMPLWIETRLPDTQGKVGDWQHLVFAQDIGTDIHGTGRADIFTGWGGFARYVAGNLHASGKMILLLPRSEARTASGEENAR